MSKTVKKPCFSNGTEWDMWTERNCDNCIKASRPKADGSYTKGRCVYQEDILHQALGMGNEEIRLATYEATQKNDCPYRKEHHKPRSKRDKDRSLNLFPDL